MATLSDECLAERDAAPRRPRRRRDLQGLRAFAVLAVVADHAGLPVPGGFTGVDVFFVLSGFVITASLLRERARTGTVSLSAFYVRRFKRLTPALALMVAVTCLGSALLLSPFEPQRLTASTATGVMLLAANEVIRRNGLDYFAPRAEANPLLHTWSLSVEEQLYLVFPALLLLAWWGTRATRPRRLVVLLLVGTLASLATVVLTPGLLAALGVPGLVCYVLALAGGFYSPVGRAWEFGAGALVALLVCRDPGTHPSPAQVARAARLQGPAALVGVAGLLALLAALVLVDGTTRWPGPATLLPVLGAAAVILAGSLPGGAGPVTRLLSAAPLVRVGDWSYSLYLWHWPLVVWAAALWPHRAVATVLAAALSVVPAVASYRLLEEPVRRRRLRTRRGLAALAVVTLVPPLALAAGLRTATAHGWWSGDVARLQDQMRPTHLGRRHGCNRAVPLARGLTGPCVWGADQPGAPVYLLGDSHADQLSDPLVEAGRRLHRPVVVAATSGCPFVDLRVRPVRPRTPGEAATCRDYVEQTLATLAHVRPGTVVVASTDLYWHQPTHTVTTPSGEVLRDAAAKERALADGLRRTVAAARAAGHQVVVVQTTPQWVGDHAWEPAECPMVSVVTSRCGARMTTAEAATAQGATREVVARVVPAAGGRVLDPWPVLCPDGVCAAEERAGTTYRDAGHLTVATARTLAPSLVAALAPDRAARPGGTG